MTQPTHTHVLALQPAALVENQALLGILPMRLRIAQAGQLQGTTVGRSGVKSQDCQHPADFTRMLGFVDRNAPMPNV